MFTRSADQRCNWHSLLGTLIVLSRIGSAIAGATDPSILQTLRAGHPRLMWDADTIRQVKEDIESDPLAKGWEANLITQADAILKAPPVERVLIGPRLLDKSRTALYRITTLAGLYRLTGDRRYADRAKKELLAVAAFSDWHPPHFLDVAEMTNAVALGYDWLYDDLSPVERTTLRRAIVSKGLEPGLAIYAAKSGWHTATYNWNQVCNGGMTVGALAIADEEPDISAKVIAAGRESIPRAMAGFAPDGGWPEGPGYWNYATQYNVYYLAALRTALGTDFGFDKSPGFADTGNFRIQFEGSSGHVFNFADAGAEIGGAPQMFWLARTFNRPAYDAAERRDAAAKPSIFNLIWFNKQFSSPVAAAALNQEPASQWFKGVQVAFLRAGGAVDGGDRNGPAVTFVGFKGGNNKANHSHLDLGTFVLDAMGQRWAISMGPDNYNLPGYFGKQRWDYYRLRTEGQNTLTIDGKNQSLDGQAQMVAFGDNPDHPFAVADLSDGYRTKCDHVIRGIALDKSGQILVQDEIQAGKPVDIIWHFHTDATVKTSDTTATLTQPAAGGKGTVTLNARILSPADAKFDLLSASPPPPQRPAPKTSDLTIRLAEKTEDARIVVVFSTSDAKSIKADVRPLAEWAGQPAEK
jgi:hypothetical protein